jgi:VCBS repeat-containing protein
VTTVDVLGNDTDPDNTLTAASITAFTQGANGTVVSNNDGTFTYTHDGSETTSDAFTYTINDGAGGIDTATVNVNVNVTINPANNAPVPHRTGFFDETDHSGGYLLRKDDGTFRLDDVNSDQVTAHLVGAVGTEWRFIGNGISTATASAIC